MLIVQKTGDLGSQGHVFKQEIKQLSGVEMPQTGELLTAKNGNWTSLFEDRGLDQNRAVHSQLWSVDEDYLGTLGIKLKSGRNFQKEMPTDSARSLSMKPLKNVKFVNLLNQSLAPAANLLKKINTYHIIGVIKYFNFDPSGKM